MVGGSRPVDVLLACSGLGHVVRGFETYARECFDALRGDARARLRLVKAYGPPGDGELTARAVLRSAPGARALGRVVRRDAYFVEQMSYAVALLPHLVRDEPDVVVVSDWALARALGRWRALARRRFRLLLSNGAGTPGPYDWAIDHVQQLTPWVLETAVGAGEPPERHTLLPLGLAVPPALDLPDAGERAERRARLGLPADREIVLSVAALNVWSKRLDYLAREVSAVRPRPYLVLLGQREEETPQVLAAARAALGDGGFTARTVAPAAVRDYYRAADVLVLASRYEALGRVLVEAMAEGLPVLAHDGESQRFVMGPHGRRADLTRPGALTALLERQRREGTSVAARLAGHAAARRRFAWEALADDYIALFERCAATPPGRWRGLHAAAA